MIATGANIAMKIPTIKSTLILLCFGFGVNIALEPDFVVVPLMKSVPWSDVKLLEAICCKPARQYACGAETENEAKDKTIKVVGEKNMFVGRKH